MSAAETTWDYSELPANVRLGEDCYIEHPLSFDPFQSALDPGFVLGDRAQVYGATAFHVGPRGRIEVGDDSVIASTKMWCHESITIGRGVTISYYVLVFDTDLHPADPDERRLEAEALSPRPGFGERRPVTPRPVVIEDGVSIGIGAIVLKGVRIGAGARVEAGAVVSRSVPASSTVAGNPARVVEQADAGAS